MTRRLLALFLLGCLALPVAAQDTSELDLAQGIFVLRTGDARSMRAALSYLRDLKAPPSERLTVFQGRDALAPLLIAWTEADYDAVLQQGEQAARAAHSPERELAVRLLMLHAAYASGRVGLERQLLTRAEELARNAPGARGRLDRFLVKTFRASDDFERTVPTQAEVLARLQAASGELAGLRGDDDYRRSALAEPALLQIASQIWVDRLVRAELFDQILPTIVKTVSELYNGLEGDAKATGVNGLDLNGARIQMAAYYHEFMSYLAYALFAHDSADFVDVLKVLQHEIDSGEQDYAGLAEVAKGSDLLKMAMPGAIARYVSVPHHQLARVLMLRDPHAYGKDIIEHLARAVEVLGDSSSSQRTELALDTAEAFWLVRPPDWDQDVLKLLAGPWTAPADRVRALMLRGQVLAQLGRKPEAVAALSQAVSQLEAYLQEFGLAGLAADLHQRYRANYDLLARLQLEAGQGASAVETLDRQNQAGSLASVHLRDLQPARADLRRDVEKAEGLRTQIVALESRADSDPALLARTRGEFYQVLDALQRKEPAYGKLSVRPNNFSRLQKDLPADTVLVQLFPAEDRLYLFVATREGLKIRQVPVSAAHLHELVESFRHQVVAYGGECAPFNWQSDQGQALAAVMVELGSLLWEPLVPDLAGKKQVVFVPTSTLYYIPMQALARAGSKRPHFLVEDLAVGVVTKSSDLDGLGKPAGAAGDSLLALADPDGSLTFARTEAVEVGAMFPGSQVFVGAEATSARLASLDPSVGYLHLATHGHLNPTTPTDTYLQVAGGSGQLTVTEIASLDLTPVRLVTLSACQTALADRVPGVGWELSSLADAFGFAGSPSMLASLWKVSDVSTHTLMLAFYRALARGAGKAEALRQAEISLLDDPRTAHPFHWAAFELLGDWR